MAKRISQLPAASAVTVADIIEITSDPSSANVSKQATLQIAVVDLLASNADAWIAREVFS